MKKMSKKLTSVLLAAMILLCSVPFVFANNFTQIPEDAVKFNGHYYKVYQPNLNWLEAKDFCEDLGGHLVTISSKEENDFVLDLVSGIDATSFLLGFSDHEKEGIWKWVTGEEVVYTNWGKRQPDNNNSSGQNAAALVNKNTYYDVSKGEWDDIEALNARGYNFICEWDEVPEETTTSFVTTEPITEPITNEPITEVLTTTETTQPTTKPTEPTTVPATQPVTEKKITVEIRRPSQTEINYGDSIILHADIEGKLPEDAEIVWSSDNGNFKIVSTSVDGTNCTVTPSSSGNTVFTATVYDAQGDEICSDTQFMTSNAGFFQKIIAFFKKLFGMTKIIPEIFKI